VDVLADVLARHEQIRSGAVGRALRQVRLQVAQDLLLLLDIHLIILLQI